MPVPALPLPATALGLFLHPGLVAAGLAAAAVPILIHLFSRRRVKRVRWAAMTWLAAALKRHQKRLRIENWLVLLLRVAALALLGVAIARWILTDSSVAELIRPKRSVVLLLDTSYSTTAKEGGRSVADRVLAEANKVLAGLSSEDTVAVLVSNDFRGDRTGVLPAVIAPRGVGREGVSRAKEEVAKVHPTEAPASWADALALAASKPVMPADDVNRTLYWITDLQAVDWRRPADPGAADPLGKALQTLHRAPCAIRVVDVGPRPAGRRNLVVADVKTLEAKDVFEGETVRLRVVVQNTGAKEIDGASLRLFVDDSRSWARTQTVGKIAGATSPGLEPPHAEIYVSLGADSLTKTPGAHSVLVTIAPPDGDAASDVLLLDSERRLAVEVRKRLKILAWVEPNARAVYPPDEILRAVFTGDGKGPGDHFELQVVRNGEADLRAALANPSWEPDLVVLGNVNLRGEQTAKDLATYVRGGGALAVFAGDHTDATTWNDAFHTPAASRLMPFPFGLREQTATHGANDVPWHFDLKNAGPNAFARRFLRVDDKDHPYWLDQHFLKPRVWGRIPFSDPEPSRRMTPSGVAEESEAVVLRFEGTGGQPGPIAAAESRYGQGRTLWVATSLDDGWLDVSFLFLPVFLNEAALELTRRPETGRNLQVGAAIHARVPRDAQAPRILVPGRGEETPELRAAATEVDRPEVAFERTATSGIYRLSYERGSGRTSGTPGRVEELFAVNPDPTEGALQRATDGEVENRAPGGDVKVLPSAEEDLAAEKGAREGEMTPYLLLLVVVLLLLEQFFAMRFGRHDRAPVENAP